MTITGTRTTGEVSDAELGELFDAYLRPFATDEVRFYIGGAAGIDTATLEWLAVYTSARLTVTVPCTVPDQPASAAEAIGRWSQQGRLDEVVELRASERGTAAYHARNRWMVDRSEFVIGFPRGTDPASGTWYTLTYAADRGKPRLVVPL
ncbi:hypothetical protein [Saccharopolyspora sp. NPDC002376]